MRVFLLLLLAAAVAALFTKPDVEAHRKVVGALFAKGMAVSADGARTYDFQDMFVVSKYTTEADGKTILECWGAFTRFLCIQPDTDQSGLNGDANS